MFSSSLHVLCVLRVFFLFDFLLRALSGGGAFGSPGEVHRRTATRAIELESGALTA
jgi:hypothetical protein